MALLVAPLTLARSSSAQDLAAAEALFRAGLGLLDRGDYAAACPKLAESNRLDPSSGTALNLALCHAKQGKTATAWAEYLVAARLAKQQQKADRAEEATKKAGELEKDLSHLTIVVTQPVGGLEIHRDDVRLEASAFGTSLPIDPGKHVVTASAPGYKSVTLAVSVGGARDAQTVAVPALEKVATQAPGPVVGAAVKPEPARVAGPAAKSGPGALPWVLGGVGVVALGVGGTFGGLALSTYGQAKTACPAKTGCSSDAFATRTRAGTFANVANVGIGVGIVGVGVAVILLATGSSHPEPAAAPKGATASSLAVTPLLDAREAGATVTGRF